LDPDVVWSSEWVGRGMGVLDGGGEWSSTGVNVGRRIVTNWDFVA